MKTVLDRMMMHNKKVDHLMIIVNYFLNPDLTILQSQYISFYCHMSQLQAAVNSLESRILDFHTPIILRSFVRQYDYVSFDLVTPTLP